MRIIIRKGSIKFTLVNKDGEATSHKEWVIESPPNKAYQCPFEFDIKGLVPKIIENNAKEVLFDGMDYRAFIDAEATVIGYDYSKGPLY